MSSASLYVMRGEMSDHACCHGGKTAGQAEDKHPCHAAAIMLVYSFFFMSLDDAICEPRCRLTECITNGPKSPGLH